MPEKQKRLSAAEVFYYIGGGVVALGIVILLRQNWEFFNLATKLLATFGFGLAAHFAGVIFSQRKEMARVGMAFFLIGALVLPIGFGVIFDEAGYRIGYQEQTMISSAMLVLYLLFAKVHKYNIFILFSILFATWLFFSITSWMVDGTGFNTSDLVFIKFLVSGLSYIFLGYAFSKDQRAPLSAVLYDLGIFAVLGAALQLGGYKSGRTLFWELIYPVLILMTIYASVFLKSKGFLFAGALFLVAYICKITVQHFADSVGWPLALIVAGLSLIGVAYVSVSISRKYLSTAK